MRDPQMGQSGTAFDVGRGENPRLGFFYLSPLRLEGTCNESSFTVLLCRSMPAMISRPYSSAMLTPLGSRPYAATDPPRPIVATDLPRRRAVRLILYVC